MLCFSSAGLLESDTDHEHGVPAAAAVSQTKFMWVILCVCHVMCSTTATHKPILSQTYNVWYSVHHTIHCVGNDHQYTVTLVVQSFSSIVSIVLC